MGKICQNCGKILTIEQKKFCSKKCSNKISHPKAIQASASLCKKKSFERVHQSVQEYKGRLLTSFDDYDSNIKVLIRCDVCKEQIRVWSGSLYSRKWICSCYFYKKKNSPKRLNSYLELSSIIQQKNGTIITPFGEYDGNHSKKIMVQCNECLEKIKTLGYSIINGGRWNCSCCRSKQYTIEHLREFGRKQGLTLLDTQYVNIRRKYKWKCHDGHRFYRTGSEIQQGKGCSKCHIYLQEERCRFILEQLTGTYFPKVRGIFGTRMELDGFSGSLKIAFEYQGIQHYQYHPYFHQKKSQVKEQQNRDKEKEKLCLENGIKLLVIPYNVAKSGDDCLIHFISSKIGVDGGVVDWSMFHKFKSNIDQVKQKLDNNHVLLSTCWKGTNIAIEFHCKIFNKDYKRPPANIKQGKANCLFCGRERTRQSRLKHDYDKAVVLYQSGMSSVEVSNLTGCNKKQLLLELKRRNIPFNAPKISDPTGKNFAERKLDYDEIKHLYNSGKSQAEIAKMLGCSEGGVNRALRQMNIQRDPARWRRAISEAKRRKKQ